MPANGHAYGHTHLPDGYYSYLVAGPETPIISLSEAKLHLRVEHDADDTLIAALVQAVTDYLDAEHGILGRALITQRWALSLSGFPTERLIALPVVRVRSVVSVTYYDSDNVQQTLPSESYTLIVNDERAAIYLPSGSDWPDTYDRPDAVTVTYNAGYGDEASDVPQAIKQAALLLIGNFYENREAVVVGQSTADLPFGVSMLLQPFRTSRALF